MDSIKEEIYIDLSKCTEEEQKNIISLLPDRQEHLQYRINQYNTLLYLDNETDLWWVNGSILPPLKTELTYPEFIRLFEGGEEEKEVQKLKKQIDLYKECFELFIPIEKWDEANEFLSINKNPLSKHLSRVQKEVEKKPKF